MSDTPRTDKHIADIGADGLVDGEFARALELEADTYKDAAIRRTEERDEARLRLSEGSGSQTIPAIGTFHDWIAGRVGALALNVCKAHGATDIELQIALRSAWDAGERAGRVPSQDSSCGCDGEHKEGCPYSTIGWPRFCNRCHQPIREGEPIYQTDSHGPAQHARLDQCHAARTSQEVERPHRVTCVCGRAARCDGSMGEVCDAPAQGTTQEPKA